MKKTALALMTLIGLSATAHADYTDFMQQKEQPYVGVDYQVSRIDNVNTVTLGSILVRAGSQMMPHLGVEVQASYGIMDDSDTTAGGVKFSVKNRGSYGIFLRPNLALNKDLTAYGLVGANYADIQTEDPAAKNNSYGTAFAAGAGLSLKINDQLQYAAELIRYDSDIIALNLGVRFAF